MHSKRLKVQTIVGVICCICGSLHTSASEHLKGRWLDISLFYLSTNYEKDESVRKSFLLYDFFFTNILNKLPLNHRNPYLPSKDRMEYCLDEYKYVKKPQRVKLTAGCIPTLTLLPVCPRGSYFISEKDITELIVFFLWTSNRRAF